MHNPVERFLSKFHIRKKQLKIKIFSSTGPLHFLEHAALAGFYMEMPGPQYVTALCSWSKDHPTQPEK
jgi:hypothetical protein